MMTTPTVRLRKNEQTLRARAAQVYARRLQAAIKEAGRIIWFTEGRRLALRVPGAGCVAYAHGVVGEETGDLDTMLYKVADVYDEEVNVMVESLISLLEPLMIVVLGFIIGTIVIALFMPLIKLLEGLSK